ncbi:platelet glycoprotein IX isoform X1 [Salmo trutta]|uniref:platelet glycoprotein IX isoform X1 n=2 Tax=Salmo trutta TaxID=8032 RepID=UPI0011307A5B|nr:platelet glycoprotein IX-like isoform X1 [Salmo trutta]
MYTFDMACFFACRMLLGSGIAILLLLATSSAQPSPKPCRCSALQPSGLQVNCSSMSLMEVPPLSPDTTELYLQDNQLFTVPSGHFDRLQDLRRVTLSGNPFHCDCGILFLRTWLRRNWAVVSGGVPTCASPSGVAHTAITALNDAYFSSCAQRSCAGWVYDTMVGVMLCGLIGLLLWGLRLAKNSTFTLDIDQRHAGLEVDSLRSLKPKHRRIQRTLSEERENSASLTWTNDPERPLINMEILPQILDVLHKKHNIKIKTI